MEDELGARERRYIEAYLELESQSPGAAAGGRERVIAAAFAGLQPTPDRVEPSHRSMRRGALILAALGACAAAALAGWFGRASLKEEPTARRHDQVPLSVRDDRSTHEASTARRRGAGEDPGATLQTPAEDGAPAVAPATAALEPSTPAPQADPASERRLPASRKRAETASPDEPEVGVPTLSDAEVALLERARRLAQQGEHAAALARLREHEATYPHSVLGRERTAEQVAVLCRMGAESAERARASFLAGDPPQYLRSRVEKACVP